MSKHIDAAEQKVMDALNTVTADLSPSDYVEVLENVLINVEDRLTVAEEELANEEGDGD